MKKIFLTLLFVLNIPLLAQEGLKFSGQIRARYEVDHKDFKSSTDANTFALLRTRFNASFVPVKNISAFVQLQDSRTFGEEPSTTANFKNADLHQAYFKIENLFELPFDLKVGRFEALYGSERFLGPVNWSNIGRSFDGGLVTFKSSDVKIDLMVAREFEKGKVGDSTDQNIYALIGDLNFSKSYKIQPFVIWQRMQPTSMLDRATLGLYVKGEFDGYYHEIDFGYQIGSFFSGGRKQDVSAYTFSFGAGYNFGGALKPTIGAQIDIASGDDNAADNDFKSYTSLYSTGHKFFGYMDYFVNFPNDTYGLGIMDIIGKVGVTLIKDLKLNLHGHIFNAMEDYKLKSGSTSKSFGTEFDLVAIYRYNDNVSFEGGASFFSAGDIFKEKRGTDTATWFYAMATVNF